TAGRFFGNSFLCLALRSHEKDGLALLSQIGDKLGRLFEKLEGLLQVDDVDSIAFAVDVLLHFGIPTACLVAKVNSSLQKFLHTDVRQITSRVSRSAPSRQQTVWLKAGSYLFENWNRLRAPFCPYFLRSLARGSRVRNPPCRSFERSSGLKRSNARAIPSFAAPTWPWIPPPRALMRTSNLPRFSVVESGCATSKRMDSRGKYFSAGRSFTVILPGPGRRITRAQDVFLRPVAQNSVGSVN